MRLIDADALKESLKELEAESNSIRYTQGLQDAIDYYFPQIIDDAPTVDAEPVKHGEWIKTDVCENQFKCSECGRTVTTNTSIVDPADFEFYCYNCGAKMDGGVDE